MGGQYGFLVELFWACAPFLRCGCQVPIRAGKPGSGAMMMRSRRLIFKPQRHMLVWKLISINSSCLENGNLRRERRAYELDHSHERPCLV